jgi:branched-chain amino acid transport system ATP-binding protein
LVDEKALVIKNLHASYGKAKVLHGVSLELNKGELTVLLGINGSGKSTLLKCIVGLVSYSGEIKAFSDNSIVDLANKKPYEISKYGITLIQDGRRIFREMTVRENLFLGAFRKDARKNLSKNLKMVYDLFPILKERENQIAGTLSGGEQQMLAIAMGLMSNPKLLLIDEPSQGLAPRIISEIMKKIKELKDHYGITIFMSEQNFVEALRIADKGYILDHGKVVAEGRASELSGFDLIKELYFK